MEGEIRCRRVTRYPENTLAMSRTPPPFGGGVLRPCGGHVVRSSDGHRHSRRLEEFGSSRLGALAARRMEFPTFDHNDFSRSASGDPKDG